MNDIRALLKVAARRLEITSFLGQAHLVAVAVAILAFLLILADRAGAQAFIPWLWVTPLLIVAGLGLALARWARRRRSDLQIALAVDERLDLREKLSTALHCEGRTDAFAQAAVEDAVTVARDPRTRESTRRKFSVGAPRGWWVSPLVVLAALMISMLQQWDLFTREAEEGQTTRVNEARLEAQESVEAVIKEIKESEELSSSFEDLLGDLATEPLDGDAIRSPEEVKREAIKKVSEINKRLDDILSGTQGKTAEALNRALSQIKPPDSGEARALAEALSKGNFAEAKNALDELAKKLQAGNLDEEQQKQLAQQLQNLAEQLEQLAKMQQQLEQALQQAGLDPKLAQNLQALEQALQNNPNLNQQQMQQLQQMAQAQQAAAQMCQGLGQACQQMAQGMMGQMGQNGQGQMGQGLGQMGQQLDQMEQLMMMLQQAQAAANACQGQAQGLGLGLSVAWQQGPGMGSYGQGRGGKAPIAPTPWGKRIVKAPVATDSEGEIIARMLIDGPQVVGESKKTAKQVVAEMVETYDDAQAEEPLPRKYHEANMHYFGELQKLTEAREADAGDGKTEEAPAPTESEASDEGGAAPQDGEQPSGG